MDASLEQPGRASQRCDEVPARSLLRVDDDSAAAAMVFASAATEHPTAGAACAKPWTLKRKPKESRLTLQPSSNL